MKSWSRKPRGAAAVEFALVLPLLCSILFGTIEWGYYFYTREIVINASREGARTGTLLAATSTDATAAAQSYLTSSGLTASNATITSVNSAGTCPAGSSCVRIQYAYSTLTGFLNSLLGPTRTIDAYAEMRK